MGIYSITDEKVKRLVPDYSASHWSPSDRMRKESAILFSDISQMSVSEGGQRVCGHFPQNMITIAWFPFSINRESPNAVSFQEF